MARGDLQRHERITEVAVNQEEETWLRGDDVPGFTPGVLTLAKYVYVHTGLECQGIQDIPAAPGSLTEAERAIVKGAEQIIAAIIEHGREVPFAAVMDGEIRPSGVLILYLKNTETAATPTLYEMPGWWSEQFRRLTKVQ